MTPEEQQLVLALVRQEAPLPDEEFLRRFGTSDGKLLGLSLLRDAIQRRDSDDVEFALIVCFRFGFLQDHFDLLIELAFADWHQRHEDVASALDDYRSPNAIGAFIHLAEWVPEYMKWDDGRALARKAIWALGKLSVTEERATQALRHFATTAGEPVAEMARRQLRRRDQ